MALWTLIHSKPEGLFDDITSITDSIADGATTPDFGSVLRQKTYFKEAEYVRGNAAKVTIKL